MSNWFASEIMNVQKINSNTSIQREMIFSRLYLLSVKEERKFVKMGNMVALL